MKAFVKGHTFSITTSRITDLKILRPLLFSVVEAQNDTAQNNFLKGGNRVRGQKGRSHYWPDLEHWSPYLWAQSTSPNKTNPSGDSSTISLQSLWQRGSWTLKT